MKFGKYQFDNLFLIFAVVSALTALLLQNAAFLGATIICCILGIKKDRIRTV